MPASAPALPLPRPGRRLWPWLLLALLLLVAAGLGSALWLAIEPAPRLPPAQTSVSVADIERARALLRHNDPRRAQPGVTRAVLLSQRDLELLLQQGARHLGGVGGVDPAGALRSRVRLQPGLAVVEAGLPLPAGPWRGWLNLRAALREGDALPTVEWLRIGRLPLPGWLAQAALPRVLDALNLRAQGELAQRLVRHVGFGAQTLVLAYAWPDNPQRALTDSLLDADAQARLRRHAEHLAATAAGLLAGQPAADGSRLARGAPLPVALLLPPVFTLARSHSPDAAAATLENRAALMALAFAAYGQRLAPLLQGSLLAAGGAGWQQPGQRIATWPLSLQGRPDFPQHLLISAALAAEGGGPLSDAIGLYKEVADSRHGSGFSFRDIAADRAGTRLGLWARRDPLGFQARMQQGVADADLMPDVSDLPEFMPEAEFKRRFGGVGAPAYQAVLREIEARLDRLPLLVAGRGA